MITRVKLYSDGYTKSYEGGRNTAIGGSYENDEEVTEFLANGGTVEPEFTDTELLKKQQSEFRTDRDILIKEADIEIFKLEDNNQDSTAWRAYRQALRDATLTWTMPAKPQ